MLKLYYGEYWSLNIFEYMIIMYNLNYLCKVIRSNNE